MVIAVVDKRPCGQYARMELGSGGSAFERALKTAGAIARRTIVLTEAAEDSGEYAAGSVSSTGESTFDSTAGASGGDEYLTMPVKATVRDTIRALNTLGTGGLPDEQQSAAGSGEKPSALVYMRGDEPFIQSDLTGQMLEQHRQFAAHYTFSDGYPAGISPEIIAPALPGLIEELVKDEEEGIVPGWFFRVLERDINAFDVETLLAPRDMRMLRIELRCDNRVNFLLCRKVAETGVDGHRALTEYLDEHRGILRTVPAFVGIQVTDGCPQTCSYCPFPVFGGNILEQRGFMQESDFSRIVEAIEKVSPEAVIGIGTWGEPLLHPELERLLARICATEGLSALVETSGIGMSSEQIVEIANRYADRVNWIVSLDANNPELYASLRGQGFEQAWRTAHAMVDHAPAVAWIQAVRMQENEEHLETFYRYWKDRTDHVIVQKYDWFSARLPQRKVTDLSPLTRLPCWQNKRELYIRMDGTVPRCREDVYNEYQLGNVFRDSLTDIWERGETVHAHHVAGEYKEICGNCDEYYIFNF